MIMSWVSLVALLLALCMPQSDAMQATVPASSEECFSIDAEKFKQGISLNYEVLRGVADSLQVELKNPLNQVLYSGKGSSGRFLAPVDEGGVHTTCFKNIIASAGDVVIGFSFHADDPTHDVLSNADATRIKHALDLEDMVYELVSNLDQVKDTQAYMKSIRRYHHEVIDSTHKRILWWACLEALVLVVVAFWQISYLRRSLEVKRVL